MMRCFSRRLACTVPQPSTRTRAFHATRPAFVSIGDHIPNLQLVEDSPGNKVNLSKELARGKGLIIGVPAAFSKSFKLYGNYTKRLPDLEKAKVHVSNGCSNDAAHASIGNNLFTFLLFDCGKHTMR